MFSLPPLGHRFGKPSRTGGEEGNVPPCGDRSRGPGGCGSTGRNPQDGACSLPYLQSDLRPGCFLFFPPNLTSEVAILLKAYL